MKKLYLIMGCPYAGQNEIADYIMSKENAAIRLDQELLDDDYYNIINNKIQMTNTLIFNGFLTTTKERQILFDNLKNLNIIRVIGI